VRLLRCLSDSEVGDIGGIRVFVCYGAFDNILYTSQHLDFRCFDFRRFRFCVFLYKKVS
jgi:hypothetical protein